MAQIDPTAIWELMEVLDDGKTQPSKSSHVATVSRIDIDGTIWARLAGSTIDTPLASTSTTVEVGDTISVDIGNKKAVGSSNLTSPAATAAHVQASIAPIRSATQAASSAAAEAVQAAESAQKGVNDSSELATAARVAADTANATANATKAYFWHDDGGAHVATTENDVTKGYSTTIGATGSTTGIVQMHDGKLLSSHTPSALNFYAQDDEGDTTTTAAYTKDGAVLYSEGKQSAAFTKGNISFFDGEGDSAGNIVAHFGKDGAQIGHVDNSRIELSSSDITMYDSQGSIAMRVASVGEDKVLHSAPIQGKRVPSEDEDEFHYVFNVAHLGFDENDFWNGNIKMFWYDEQEFLEDGQFDPREYGSHPTIQEFAANADGTVESFGLHEYPPGSWFPGKDPWVAFYYTVVELVDKSSYCFGEGLETTHENQVAFGKYNEDTDDALLSIGNGANSWSRTNVFSVSPFGDTTIKGSLSAPLATFGVGDDAREQIRIDGSLTRPRAPESGVSFIAGATGQGALVYQSHSGGDVWLPSETIATHGGGSWQIGNYNTEELEFIYATKENIASQTNTVNRVFKLSPSALSINGEVAVPIRFRIRGTTIDADSSTNAVSANTYEELLICDKDNEYIGGLSTLAQNSGYLRTSIYSRNKKADKTWVYNNLELGVNKDGTRKVVVTESAPWRNALGASSGIWPVSLGGTGATTAANALKNIMGGKTILYNSTATNANITLSQTAANFNHMAIYFRVNGASNSATNPDNCVLVYAPNGKYVTLMGSRFTSDTASHQFAVYRINGTSLARNNSAYMNVLATNNGVGAKSATTMVYIFRVEAWNE